MNWEVVNEDNEKYHRDGAARHNSAQNLRWIAEMLDGRFRVLGIRFGWDSILGLIPGFGDIATNLVSFYLMIQASSLGAPPSVILRMGLNLVIDNLLDMIPLIGNLADVFWRANIRNVNLLERYMLNPRRATVSSRWVVGFTLVVVVFSALACAALALYFSAMLIQWIFGASNW